MATSFKTPGVYVYEENAFPNSAVAVETAVPVFIGYTQTASRAGKSLLRVPTKIASFAEYVELFGNGFKAKFNVGLAAPASPPSSPPVAPAIQLDKITIVDDNTAYLYNSIRLFFANDGSTCYILSVGTYGNDDTLTISGNDFIGGTTTVFDILEKEFEPTMIVMPDVIALGASSYNTVYSSALLHCSNVQSRIAIFDIRQPESAQDTTDALVEEFRGVSGIGTNNLNYGVAYFPWLKTEVVPTEEVDYRNISNFWLIASSLATPNPTNDQSIAATNSKLQTVLTAFQNNTSPSADDIRNFHQSLVAASQTYKNVLAEIRSQLNVLPPSGAMAGVYTMVDNARGVWKAPANVSINLVDKPTINISDKEQENLNVDVMAGKSINVIRPFPGIGTLVWGARTLDGNSDDWRYINVRRTLIMIEQSLKLATRAYVFEPNDSGTWITVKSMFTNFLTNLWKQGALVGPTPDLAFSVQIGLGSTMTPDDILEGIMRITVLVAVVHPAEFIAITFKQQLQAAG
jgi:phage tail sheath protein FI